MLIVTTVVQQITSEEEKIPSITEIVLNVMK
jgi:hypothetical protein